MKKILKDIRGMSLLEIMIAMVILAVGLLGLAGLQVTAIEGNRFAGDMTVATNLALNKLEELRGLQFMPPNIDAQLIMSNNWDADNNGVVDGNFCQDALDHTEAGIDAEGNAGGWYNRGWNIFDVDSDGNGIIDTKLICVIVTWTDMLGVNRRVNYSTMITKSNPYNYDD